MSKFLSMQWFKSRIEHAVEKVITTKIENLMEQEDNDEVPEFTDPLGFARKPYLNIKMVNDVLTVVMKDGDILTKPNATAKDFVMAKDARTEEDIYLIIATPEVISEKRDREAEVNKLRALHRGIDQLRNLRQFKVEGNTVYLAGINRSLPQLLVEKFIEIVYPFTNNSYLSSQEIADILDTNDEFLAHKRFFLWCCLNPRAEVADSLYDFLSKNGMKITKQGFFVALRNIVVKHGSAELVDFVSNAYNKVKAVWKKSPDKYYVFLENEKYKLVHEDDMNETKIVECDSCDGDGEYWYEDENRYVTCDVCEGEGQYERDFYVDNGQMIGNLTELYLDLPNRHENRFTDNWTKTFDIRVGQVVSMPIDDCNWSTQDCAAAGLHFAGHTAPYVLCGDTTVFTLHNPMKVVGIGEEKGRCYEYLPFMTTTVDEADEIMNSRDFDFLQLDEEYAINELKGLEEKVKAGFVAEAKKYDFNLPHISAAEIKNIVASLEDMKSEISGRVSNID
jgi:hypothetical protein